MARNHPPAFRLAVVSDLHGNLAAFRAVLADVRRRAVDEVVLAGDLVQGGRQPDAVLDLVMELVAEHGWTAVRGNADQAILETAAGRPLSSPEASDELLRGLRWTVERLTPDQLAWLDRLPLQQRRPLGDTGELVVVHATPWSLEDFVPPDAPEETAARMLAEARARVLAYGHIHSAYQRQLPAGMLASVGAVSGSNDADPRPAYSVFHFEPEPRVEVHRVDYDAAAETAALLASGYPTTPERARRYQTGGTWPVRA